MTAYRTGLWLLVGGLLWVLAIWVGMDIVRVLYATGEEPFPLRFADALAIADAISVAVLVAGALIARSATSGMQRSWLGAVAVAFALYEVLRTLPWLLSQIGTEIGAHDFLWLMRGASTVHLSALAAIVVMARAGLGPVNRALHAAALWLIGVQAMIVMIDQPSASRSVQTVTFGLGICCVLAVIGVLVDQLGAFGTDDRDAPDARVRNHARGTTSVIAVGLLVVGTGLSAFAVWATKRAASVTSSTDTLVIGTLIFMAGAATLWRIQRRSLPVMRFVFATVIALVLGHLVLAAYVG